ncbi:hypothetical protein [Candidatus Protochlamydia amoebophila]|uniref:Uncharacterized protein n=2 Tax=Candidatus Protochlamydia amoebophila TaxID=362787 RepID=Q6MEH9_PARUW|nr:hypothetical protein [Candidatus Protochlamydia amoebophila]KIC73680.1 hypothetical protein DB44_AX00020 [Candidatus Protochlamydia amoebophila]CAF23020.1 unnamed protein product [Candidatus Protochlamydia amoebophila UWE25]
MNNINSCDSSTIVEPCYTCKRFEFDDPKDYQKQLIRTIIRVLVPIDRIGKWSWYLVKIYSIARPIFKILFQIFEFINRCACLLAKGLISIKTKLVGIDLHIHLFTVVNVQQPCCSHIAHRYTENALSV